MVELIWEGKYDKDCKRVAPLKVALPFQTVETVNEDPIERRRQLELFAAGRDTEWRNRLIWGDKKYVLPSLLPEFAGKVDLIYIDPPFATGQDFSYQAKVGDDEFTKEASIVEQKAYRDTWGGEGGGLSSYLTWFYKTIVFLQELLSESGIIYVHCDPTISHFLKAILDEVFGSDNFRNEIIWSYRRWPAKSQNFQRMHDIIFFYSKSTQQITWNQLFEPLAESTLKADGGKKIINVFDETGRRKRGVKTGEQSPGAPMRDVWNIGIISPTANERLGYPTQKPEALVERMITATSNEGDLVLDCFCGSGTTAAVAEKTNRRWIACDLGRFAIHTTRKRLLGIENVRPFVVQNLGKYERQVWQKTEFGEEAAFQIRRYRKFILDLYHAEMLEGYAWLHGKKGRRMVHVGSVDSPVAVGEVRQMAIELRRALGSGKNAPTLAGLDILGWDFALDMNETAKQIAAEAGVKVRFLRIPREVLEKKAVDQGDIQFFELAALAVDLHQQGRNIMVQLTDFMVPPDDVPDEVAKAVRDWKDWIDYWAVDFNYRDDTFHNMRQYYRTPKNRELLDRITHKYEEPGEYTILVKAIDILGNDTTKSLTVKVV